MPKKYRDVRTALVDAGWQVLRQRGSHEVWGVVALGATREEVSQRIREAVVAYAEEMGRLGRPLPEPVAAAGTIEAA